MESAGNAEGSALKENEKYIQSIEGKISILKSELQELATDTIKSDFIKGAIDGITKLVKAIDWVIERLGVLKTLGLGAGVFLGLKNIKELRTAISGMTQLGEAVNNLKTLDFGVTGLNEANINAYRMAVAGLSQEQATLLLSTKGLNQAQIELVLSSGQVTASSIAEAAATGNVVQTKNMLTAANQQLLLTSYGLTSTTLSEMASRLGLTTAENGALVAKKALNVEMVKQELTAMGVVGVTQSQIISMLGLATAETAATMSTNTLTGAFEALKLAMMTNPIFAAITILTTLISVIGIVAKAVDKYTTSAEEAKQKSNELMESFKSAINVANTNAKRVDELSDRYKKLSEGVRINGENMSLTTEEYDEYNSIVNEIADMFPELVQGYTDEGNAILSLKGNVDQLTNAYKDAQKEAYRLLIVKGEDGEGDGNDVLQVWRDLNNTDWLNKLKDHGNNEVGMGISMAEAIEQLETFTDMSYEKFKQAKNAWLVGYQGLTEIEKEVGMSGYISKALGIDGKLTEEEFYDARKKARGLIAAYNTEMKLALSNTKSIANAFLEIDDIGLYEQLSDDAKSAVSMLINSIDSEIANSIDDDLSKVASYVEEIVTTVSSNKEVEEALVSLFTMNTSDMPYEEVKTLTDEYINTIATAIGENPDNLKVRLGFDYSNTDALVTKVQGFLEDEFDDKVGELTLAELEIAATLDPVETKKNAEEELQKLSEGGSVNLLVRPTIDTSELNEKGWDAGEGVATVFTTTISNTDFDDLTTGSALDNVAINFTPIIADPETGAYKGTLTKEELYKYAHDVMTGVREDDLNLQIGAKFTGVDAIKEAEAAALKIHELHERYYIDDGVLLSWDQLIARMKEAKAVQNSGGSIFDSETNNKAIDEFQSRVESLKDGLKTLGSGKMKGGALIDFLQEFPELADDTDNLDEAIRNLIDKSLEDLYEVLGDGTAQEFKEELKGIADEAKNVSSALSSFSPLEQIEQLSDGLDQLSKIYEDVSNKEDFDWSSILNNDGFEEAFGNLGSAYDDFIMIVASSPNDIKACQDAFNNLAGAYLYNYGVLDNLTEETKGVAIAMLEQWGITNATEIVTKALTKAEAESFVSKKNLANVTAVVAQQLIEEGKAAGYASDMIYQLALEEIAYGESDLNLTEKIEEIYELADAYEDAGLKAAASAIMSDPEFVHSSIYKDDPNAILKDLLGRSDKKEETEVKLPTVNYKPKITGSSSSSAKETKQTMNWIERKLNVLAKAFDVLMQKANGLYTTFKNQNKQLDEATKNIKAQIKAQTDAKKKYESLANAVKLDEKIKEKVRNGAIQVEYEKYDSETKKNIDLYQEYYDAAIEAGAAVDELKVQQRELNSQRLSNIVDDYDKLIARQRDLIELREAGMGEDMTDKDYHYLVRRQNQIKELLEAEKTNLEKEFKSLMEQGEITKYSELWFEWKEAISGVGKEIENVNKELKETALRNLDAVSSKYGAKVDNKDAKIARREAKIGDKEYTNKDYKFFIKAYNDQKYNLAMERAELEARIKQELKAKNLTEAELDEYKNRLIEIDTKIYNIDNSIADLNKARLDKFWEQFDKGAAKLDRYQEELGNIQSLFTGDMFDKDGNITDDGMVHLTTAFQGIASTQKEIKYYEKAIAELNDQLKDGEVTQEYYNERINELTDGMQAASLQAKEYRDSVIDIYVQGLEAAKEAELELIEAQKERLQSEKELDDYVSKSKDAQDDITTLKKRIAALSRSTNRKDIALRLDLEEELAEKEKEQAKEQADHAYDVKVDALDKESEAIEKEYDQRIWDAQNNLDTQERILNEYLKKVQNNWTSTMDSITTAGETFGYNMTEYYKAPFDEAIKSAKKLKKLLKKINGGKLSEYKDLNPDMIDKETKNAINSAAGDKNAVKDLGYDGAVDKAEEKVQTEVEKDYKKAQKEANSGTKEVKENTTPTTTNTKKDNDKDNTKKQKVSTIVNVIKRGGKATSSEIKILQTALEELGFSVGKYGIDGNFGNDTEDAVKNFQSSTKVKGGKIKADGKVGPETKKKFKANGYKYGVKDLDTDQLSIINEVGQEMVLRPSEGILFPMQKHDTVLTADQTDNLLSLSKLDEDALRQSWGMDSSKLLHSIGSNGGFNTFGDINVSMNITGVTRDEINRETQKMIENIPNTMMTELRKHGVGVNGSRRR